MTHPHIATMAAMWEYARQETDMGRLPVKVVGPCGKSQAHFRGTTLPERTRCGRHWEHEWFLSMVSPNEVCRSCVRTILSSYVVATE